jgi:hypothetical protein
MLELILFAIAATCLTLLGRPLLARVGLPAWLVRARIRRRPGIPVTAWILALLSMELAWMIGDRRGLGAILALLLWTGLPMLAIWLTWYWLRGLRPREEGGWGREAGGGETQEAGGRRLEAGGWRQEAGEERQELGDGRRETGIGASDDSS